MLALCYATYTGTCALQLGTSTPPGPLSTPPAGTVHPASWRGTPPRDYMHPGEIMNVLSYI